MDRKEICQALQMYAAGDDGHGSKVKSFYKKNKERLRVCGVESMNFIVGPR